MENDMTPMNLGALIVWLKSAIEKHGPDTTWRGFCDPDSYRGNYYDLAFITKDVTLARSLECAEMSLGTMFCGWKGGEYYMDEDSMIHSAHYGVTGPAITLSMMESMLESSKGVKIPTPEYEYAQAVSHEDMIKNYARALGYDIASIVITPIPK